MSERLLNEAERQILAMLYALETRAEEWWNGRGFLDEAALEEHARRFWADELAPWAGHLDALVERGLIERRAGELSVAPAARETARGLRAAFRRQRFDDILVQAERSQTYLTFCRRTSDLDLRVFSPLDQEQLSAVERALALRPGERLLDAGCGAGHVAQWLAGRMPGVHVLGIDHAGEAIRLARRRTRGIEDGTLTFAVWDFADEASEAPVGRFDAILAIDSVAFVDDLEAVLARLLARLEANGRLVVLTLEADVGEAPTARALSALGARTEVLDLTDQTLPILRARAFAARGLAPAFRREGCALLARALNQEAERLEPLLAAGRLRRRLYCVRSGSVPES